MFVDALEKIAMLEHKSYFDSLLDSFKSGNFWNKIFSFELNDKGGSLYQVALYYPCHSLSHFLNGIKYYYNFLISLFTT